MKTGVRVFICPECGFGVRAEKSNMITPLTTDKIKILVCPHSYFSGGIQHVVAIKFYGTWRDPKTFMFNPNKNGILPVARGTEDEVTLHLLWVEARKEGRIDFRHPDLNRFKAKIYWHNGKAIGYYIYYDSPPYDKMPMLNQVFVLKKYRGMGFGTKLIEDFLKTFIKTPQDEVYVEEPNEIVTHIIIKLGYGDKVRVKRARL